MKFFKPVEIKKNELLNEMKCKSFMNRGGNGEKANEKLYHYLAPPNNYMYPFIIMLGDWPFIYYIE